MTIQELYASIDGSYESVRRILPMDKLIDKFIRKFLNDDTYTRLENARKTNDAAGMFESSHAMKGVCANLGLDTLSALAGEIADEFRPGRDRKWDDSTLNDKLEQLKALYEKTQSGIRSYAEQ